MSSPIRRISLISNSYASHASLTPLPPTGDFASCPPKIFGAIYVCTQLTIPACKADPFNAAPPSKSTLSIFCSPSCLHKSCKSSCFLPFLSYVSDTSRILQPLSVNTFCFSLSVQHVASIVGISFAVVTTSESAGVRSDVSQIILTGECPSGRRQFNIGLSAITVPTPAIIAAQRFLSSCKIGRASCRERV